uniref:CC domain-containing protein n=1 Tax=Heterorhabditis bacteriophora TaxID=37862 RepID=A0A1I7XTK5_HETBA
MCSASGECPPGLFCDPQLMLCCPLILPLTGVNNPINLKSRRETLEDAGKNKEIKFFKRMNTLSSNTFSGCGLSCIMPVPTNGCIGCGAAAHPKIITIPQNMCPGGGYGVGSCNSGYCSPGYSCIQNSCCPSFSPMRQIFCPNGNQAAGGCVNGQCGTGYTCQNGLCCAGSSTSTVRCLDGSEAVGACIPSCQGSACGGMQISYYCGSGYTCTTGNICCPVNSCPNGGEPLGPTVNGLCPTGYTVQGSLCCSSLCPGGSAGSPAVNGLCPAGLTLTNGICCSSNFAVCESAEISIGPCINGGCTDLGYACDAEQVNCCPLVNYRDPANQVGPGLNGICPVGYAIVYIPGENLNEDGTNPGTCVSLQSSRFPGICAENAQSGPCINKNCPNGFTCFTAADVCCPTTAFRRLRPGQSFPASQRPPNYGRPLHSYMSPHIDATLCPNRAASAGPCMNDLCGIGLECQNGQCCQREKAISMCPNGQTAVSGCFADGTCGTSFECVKSINLCCPPGGNHILPPTNRISPNPIGARCMQDMECVGYNDGLSLCHAGVCQCSPIAYSQGIACVQRKAFRKHLNHNPSTKLYFKANNDIFRLYRSEDERLAC